MSIRQTDLFRDTDDFDLCNTVAMFSVLRIFSVICAMPGRCCILINHLEKDVKKLGYSERKGNDL
jgi:hypothetical protein